MLHSCDVTLRYPVTMSWTRRDSFHNLVQTVAPHIAIMLQRWPRHSGDCHCWWPIMTPHNAWKETKIWNRLKFCDKAPIDQSCSTFVRVSDASSDPAHSFLSPSQPFVLNWNSNSLTLWWMELKIKIFLRLCVALFVIRAGQDGVITRNVRALIMRGSSIIFSDHRWRVIDVQVK